MISYERRLAVATQDWTAKPYDTWQYEARKVKPNKLFLVCGKNYLNSKSEKYETAMVTMHRLSEAKKFAEYWESKLGMTDIQLLVSPLTWEPQL